MCIFFVFSLAKTDQGKNANTLFRKCGQSATVLERSESTFGKHGITRHC